MTEPPWIYAGFDRHDQSTWTANPWGLDPHAIEEVGEQFIQSVLDLKVREAGVLIEKQYAYGPYNIARPPSGIEPQTALLVRLNDKIQRLGTLLASGTTNPSGTEARADSWLDVSGYGSIGSLIELGLWPGLDR